MIKGCWQARSAEPPQTYSGAATTLPQSDVYVCVMIEKVKTMEYSLAKTKHAELTLNFQHTVNVPTHITQTGM